MFSIRPLLNFLIIASLAFISGCGGGTIGTQTGEERSFSGQVKLEDGSPVVGLTVSVLSPVDGSRLAEGETDAEGKFDVKTDSSDVSLSAVLSFEDQSGSKTQASVEVDQSPAVSVTVVATKNETGSIVAVVVSGTTLAPTATATVAATIQPTSAPLATSTPVPVPPTATAVIPTATPTSIVVITTATPGPTFPAEPTNTPNPTPTFVPTSPAPAI